MRPPIAATSTATGTADAAAAATTPAPIGAAVGERRRFRIGEFGWIWLATAVLFAVSAVIAPGTVRASSLLAMAPFASFLAIVAIGQTLVIRQKGLDMSSGGMMTLAGLFVAVVAAKTQAVLPAIVATLVLGALVGMANGLLVARVHISPIVTTLAVNALLIGGGRALSGGTPLVVPVPLQAFSKTPLLGLPIPLLFTLAFVVVVSVVVNATVAGRRFIAVGANPHAAAASGIRILRYQVGAYVSASLCYSLAGMMLAGFIGFASQSAGNDYLLPGIVAVVVGGTPFGGGRGSVVASAVAALFMAQLSQLVLSLGASTATQLLVQAAAIVVATSIHSLPGWLATVRRRLR